MREMCLRMELISWILAPEASSSRVVACFSSRVMPSAGSRHQRRRSARDEADHQVVLLRPGGDLRDPFGAGHAVLIRHRMAALIQLDAAQLGRVPILHVEQAGGDAAAFYSGRAVIPPSVTAPAGGQDGDFSRARPAASR